MRAPAERREDFVTIESLIAEAEAARSKAMREKGGAAAAVSALTAKAKLAGMWREKVDTHNTGTPVYERIERTIVEHHTKPPGSDEPVDERPPQEFEPPTSGRHWLVVIMRGFAAAKSIAHRAFKKRTVSRRSSGSL
jgi:hypothetical protein